VQEAKARAKTTHRVCPTKNRSVRASPTKVARMIAAIVRYKLYLLPGHFSQSPAFNE